MTRLELTSETVAVLPKREVLWIRFGHTNIKASSSSTAANLLSVLAVAKSTANTVVIVSG
jgi:hypothetical protein